MSDVYSTAFASMTKLSKILETDSDNLPKLSIFGSSRPTNPDNGAAPNTITAARNIANVRLNILFICNTSKK